MYQNISHISTPLGQSKRAKKRQAKWRLAQMIKKEQGCIDCGYNEHGVALQFDHIGNDKKAGVSDLIRSDYGWETIKAEINKCVVRCANCHAIITSERKRYLYSSTSGLANDENTSSTSDLLNLPSLR